MTIANRDLARPVRVGLELATRLRARHRDGWRAERMRVQLGDEPTFAALLAYPETSPVSPP